MVLKTGDAALVAVQCSDEFTGVRVPDFDCSVAGCGNDVLLVEVHHIDGCSMTDLKSLTGITNKFKVYKKYWTISILFRNYQHIKN